MKFNSDMTVQKLVEFVLNGDARIAAQKLEEEGQDPVDIYSDLLMVCDCLEQAAKRLHTFMGHYICEKGIMATDFLKIIGRK